MKNSFSTVTESYISQSEIFKRLTGHESLEVNTLEGYPLSRAVRLWQRKVNRLMVVIMPTDDTARSLCQDLGDCTDTQIVLLPSSGKQLYAPYTGSSAEVEQGKAIERICEMKSGIVIASVRAFCSPVISRSSLKAHSLRIKVHDRFDPASIASSLSKAGYFKASSCYEPGTFSMKGEVMEIFPFSSEEPLRIYAEWDEITRIAWYDSMSQQAIRTVSNAVISLLGDGSDVTTSSFESCLSGDEYLFFAGYERCETAWKAMLNEAKALFRTGLSAVFSCRSMEKLVK